MQYQLGATLISQKTKKLFTLHFVDVDNVKELVDKENAMENESARSRRGYSFTKKRGPAANGSAHTEPGTSPQAALPPLTAPVVKETSSLPEVPLPIVNTLPPVKAPDVKPAVEKKRKGLPTTPSPSIVDGSVERKVNPRYVSPLAVADEWTEDTTTDTTYGLGAEGKRDWEDGLNQNTGLMTPSARKKRKRRFVLTERDVAILTLLGKYRFGYRSQIERFCDTKDLSRRLTQLANAGYLRNEMITQTQALWTPTQLGLDAADLDVPVLAGGRIAPSTIAHTVGLLNIGMELEMGRKDSVLLGDPDWPYKYRRYENQSTGLLEYLPGETIITERMITQSHNQRKNLYDGDLDRVRKEIDKVMSAKPNRSGYGAEAEEGDEFMYVMHAPGRQHTPDMVLQRPRDPKTGLSQHVAIELELSSKTVREWRNILTMYAQSKTFQTVVYFTHKRSIVNSLRAVNAEHVRLPPDRFVIRKYIPTNRNVPFWG